MLFVLTLLLPVALATLWLFFRKSPRRAPMRPVHVFNALTLLITAPLCAWVVLAVRDTMAATRDHAWWVLMGTFYGLLTLTACLAVAAGIRHLLFRPRGTSKPLDVPDLRNTRF